MKLSSLSLFSVSILALYLKQTENFHIVATKSVKRHTHNKPAWKLFFFPSFFCVPLYHWFGVCTYVWCIICKALLALYFPTDGFPCFEVLQFWFETSVWMTTVYLPVLGKFVKKPLNTKFQSYQEIVDCGTMVKWNWMEYYSSVTCENQPIFAVILWFLQDIFGWKIISFIP